MPLWLTESDLRRALPPAELIDAMETALAAYSAGEVVQPLRTVLELGGQAFFASMPAYLKQPGALGAKLVSVVPSNAGRIRPALFSTRLMPSHRIPKAVIDTGPLFNVLVLSYVHAHLHDAVLEKAHIHLETDVQHAYLALFSDIRTVLTTSHVIGEVQGLQKRLHLSGQSHENFWAQAIHFLTAKSLDERLIGLLEMGAVESSRQAVCRIGPTDVGLIQLALREGCVLLTEDERTLAPLAWELGVDCRLVGPLVGTLTG